MKLNYVEGCVFQQNTHCWMCFMVP